MTVRAAVGVALVLGVGGGGLAASQTVCASPPMPLNLFRANVSKVVDGDTVHIRLRSGPTERLRLIGIDTPEMYESEKLNRDARQSGRSKTEIQVLGQLAKQFTEHHLGNKQIGLEFDVQSRDAYGRWLAYAWLSSSAMFNVMSLREGYAQVLTMPPNVRYVELFLVCQREAREARRGLWAR